VIANAAPFSAADQMPATISSLQNPRVKRVVKLRQRSHRDELGVMLVEGYREIRRAVDNRHFPDQLFTCAELFQGTNEPALIADCRGAGAEIIECTPAVFRKMAYRDRPEGLLTLAPQVHTGLDGIVLPDNPLVIVAQAIEKPGNLGSILRSADAAGAGAVLVCDRCTDINNPNVVRASIGTLFSLPVAETTTDAALPWLRSRAIRTIAATPHAEALYTDTDLTGPTAIVLGTEQYGLTDTWLSAADTRVRIPMLGQSDSLNVSAAATILLYEAVRQRTIVTR
jgi:TrmH family RNA methyltransferase